MAVRKFARWMWRERSGILSSAGLEASVSVWAMVLNWSSMQLEAPLARDRSGHAGVCRYSPLKCRTGVSYNNRVEKWRDRGRSSWQIRESDLGEHVGEHGCGSWRSLSTTSLGRSLTRLDPDEHRGFLFRKRLKTHFMQQSIRHWGSMSPVRHLLLLLLLLLFWFRPWPPCDHRRCLMRRRAPAWKDPALSQESWPRTWLSSIEARCRGTRTSTPRHIVREPPFETEPASGPPCRVEYHPRIDETWFRGTSWSLRWGIRRQRRGQVRGRFPEERQNRSSRHRTWDPRWPCSTICKVRYDRIQADASPHTPKLDSSRSNSLSVSIVSNAAEISSDKRTLLDPNSMLVFRSMTTQSRAVSVECLRL